jgi:hypothetical protein
MEALINYWWKYKMYQLMWKTVSAVLPQLNTDLPCDSEIQRIKNIL